MTAIHFISIIETVILDNFVVLLDECNHVGNMVIEGLKFALLDCSSVCFNADRHRRIHCSEKNVKNCLAITFFIAVRIAKSVKILLE